MAPALAEVIAVYEQGKPRIVSIDILKEFQGENNVHCFPSDPPPHPSFKGGDEITEIPNLELRDQEQKKSRYKRDSWTEENETQEKRGIMQVRQNHRRSDRLTTRHRSHLIVKRPGGEPPPTPRLG